MATDREYLQFIMEQLSETDGLTCRAMMGEYLLYLHGRIAAYVCDNRLLVKPVAGAVRMMPDAGREPPYPGAKEMLLVDRVDDRAFLQALFAAMYPDLPEPSGRKKACPSKKRN